ncbi:unnamed protein product [Scytosiphon promiscuus]
MMRLYALSAALLAKTAAAHPLCYVDAKPTDYDEVLTFCPEAQAGACCTDLEEAEVEARYDAVSTVPLTGDCADLYKEVVCGICHSYSGHLYEQLGAELGILDGMTMKSAFCEELVDACSGQVTFPTYDDGEDYCEKHTGGGDDFFWSYPYDEPEIFEPGLNDFFPDLDEDDFPSQTVSLKQSPDSTMYWLVGQAGEVKTVDADNMDGAETVVDLAGALLDGGDFYLEYEEGLLDATFGPMFGIDGYPDYFYLSFTCQLDDGEGARNRLSKFEYFAGDPTATRNSEEVLLTSAPRSTSIHAAGWCGFKPSAYGNAGSQDLYWSTGDAGPQTDPDNNGQNTDNLFGSIIRISVPADGIGYTIPSGNLDTGLPEICASGFRNPWRCSFDRQTEELYCGDVGHTNVEEIDIVECGKNYGWSRFEGSRCQEAVEDNEFNPPCDGVSRSGFEFPWFEYCHPDYDSSLDSEQEFTNGVNICGERSLLGHSVIGGFVYRGMYFNDLLDGAYIFGDNTNKNVYFIKEEDDGTLTSGSIISDGSLQIIGFAEDNTGELMFIDQSYNIYHMPCGDLCATTCLEQVEAQPTYTSLGCFADDVDDRGLANMAPECGDGETAMSPAICASYCGTVDGSVYAAVQYGFECFCGGEEASSGDQYFGRHGSSDACEMLCTGNPDELCGGDTAMEVFLLGAPEGTEAPDDTPLLEVDPEPIEPEEPTDDASYLGCYSDPADSRIFLEADSSTAPQMSAEVCSALCASFPFYGTQYAEECWCGSNVDYDANGEGLCNLLCAGAIDGEYCGGVYAMSVYENDGTITTTTAPVDIVEPTDPSFLGCFSDPADSRVFLEADSSASSSMTAELCSGLCAEFPFYGTQYAIECWCGSNIDYDANGAGVCDMVCGGASDDEVCGGVYAMSIYETADPTEPTYLGCWSDPRGVTRVMSNLVASTEDMTTEVCAELCATSTFFGTQYGVECWCGDASTDFEANGGAVCDYDCAGDASEACGGFEAISVYELP